MKCNVLIKIFKEEKKEGEENYKKYENNFTTSTYFLTNSNK